MKEPWEYSIKQGAPLPAFGYEPETIAGLFNGPKLTPDIPAVVDQAYLLKLRKLKSTVIIKSHRP